MRAPSSSCPSSSSSPHPHRLMLLLPQGSRRHPACIMSTPSSTHVFVFPQSPPAPVPFSFSAPSHGLLHGCTKGRERVCVKGQKQCQGVEKEEKEEEVKILLSPTDFPRSSLKVSNLRENVKDCHRKVVRNLQTSIWPLVHDPSARIRNLQIFKAWPFAPGHQRWKGKDLRC